MKNQTYPGDAIAMTLHADLDGHAVRALEMPFSDLPVVLVPDVLKALGTAPEAAQGQHKGIPDTLRSMGVEEDEILRVRWWSKAGETDKRLHLSSTFITLKGLSQAIGKAPVRLIDPWREGPQTVAA